MAVDAALLDRAGELKRELVAFSQQLRYDRAFSEVLAQHGDGSGTLDEHRLMMLWDYFVLEHRLRNGRTIVEQFTGIGGVTPSAAAASTRRPSGPWPRQASG
jgi:hypothetical protein